MWGTLCDFSFSRDVFSFLPNAKVWDDPLALLICTVWSIGGSREGRQWGQFFFIYLYSECSPFWTPCSGCELTPADPIPKPGCESINSQVSLDLQMPLPESWLWFSANLPGFLLSISVWPLRIPHFLAHSCLHLKTCYLYFSYNCYWWVIVFSEEGSVWFCTFQYCQKKNQDLFLEAFKFMINLHISHDSYGWIHLILLLWISYSDSLLLLLFFF